MADSDYQVRAFCKCGFSDRAPFGDLWFVRQRHPVCPQCGESSHGFERKVARYVIPPGWFKSGHWEVKDASPLSPSS